MYAQNKTRNIIIWYTMYVWHNKQQIFSFLLTCSYSVHNKSMSLKVTLTVYYTWWTPQQTHSYTSPSMLLKPRSLNSWSRFTDSNISNCLNKILISKFWMRTVALNSNRTIDTAFILSQSFYLCRNSQYRKSQHSYMY